MILKKLVVCDECKTLILDSEYFRFEFEVKFIGTSNIIYYSHKKCSDKLRSSLIFKISKSGHEKIKRIYEEIIDNEV